MPEMKDPAIEKWPDTLAPGTPEELAGPYEGPAPEASRFPTLDVLRGFALLGILMLNIDDFAGPESLWDFPIGGVKQAFTGWHAHLDAAIVLLKWLLAEGKMRNLFSMLFGAGVVLLTERIESRSGPARARGIYYRRNLWLLFFGLCHGFLIWFGDILVDYSVLALVALYPLRQLPARMLLGIGVLVWLVGGSFGMYRFLGAPEMLRTDAQLQAATTAGSAATLGQRRLLEETRTQQAGAAAALAEQVHEERLGYWAGRQNRIKGELGFLAVKFSSLGILEWLGAMIVGMGLYKTGYLTNRLPARTYGLIAIACYAVSWPLTISGVLHVYGANFSPATFARWIARPYTLEVATGALGNASVLLLLLRSAFARRLLAPLGAVGRTAFSNYILTSLLCKFIFSWGPWKLYGQLEYYQWLYVVAAVWTVNLILSATWLRVFAFGPLEWLWRSLTYWRPQPMRLRRTVVQSGS